MLMKYDRPPDGGWGWVVTFVAFLSYAVGWGIPRGLSVLFQDFQDNFHSTNSQTSWIISLMGGLLLIGTLLGSAINSVIGSRKTMMTGGVLATIGMIILSQSQHLWFAYMGSVITGLGFGFSYCSGPSQVGIYFDKKRSIAFSIASIGAPGNAILMPLLLVYLSDVYSWRGAVLLSSGICLHLSLGGALLRPVILLSWFRTNSCSDVVDVSKADTGIDDDAESRDKSSSLGFLDHNRNPKVDRMNFLSAWSASAKTLNAWNERSEDLKSFPKFCSLPQLFASCNETNRNNNSELLPKQFYSKSSLRELNIKNYNNDDVIKACFNKRISGCNLRFFKNEAKENLVRSFIQPYLFLAKQWRFLLFCLVGLLDFSARLTPASFIVIHVQSEGFTKDEGAFLLVIFSILDTIIRPISGFTTNRISQEKLRLGIEVFMFGSAQFIIFLMDVIAPHCSTILALSLYMSLYGIGNGLNSSWCFPILSRLVPAENLQQGVGMFHFCCGIGFLCGPPIAGYLADLTGHYYAVFYFSGFVMFLSGTFAWILYFLTRKYGIRKLYST